MSHPAEGLLSEPESGERSGVPAGSAVRLVRTADGQGSGGPGRSQTTSQAGTAVHDQLSAGPAHVRTMPSWPLLVLALPATVAVWSGWVGIGQMTGFGQVAYHLLTQAAASHAPRGITTAVSCLPVLVLGMG